jgi:hypothetical protein
MKEFLMFALLFFYACGPNLSNPDVKKIYDEVILIHDQIMPEISTIHKLKKEIKSSDKQDSLVMIHVMELDKADEAMMDWMAEFSKYRKMDNESDSLKINYLTDEKNKISRISNQMQNAIKNAQIFLSQ